MSTESTSVKTNTYRASCLLASVNIGTIPILTDGSKSPPIKWTPYQKVIADAETRAIWFADGSAMAVVCGAVSQLMILDFDRPGLVTEFIALMRDHDLGDLADSLVIIETPRGGAHLWVRHLCPPTSTKLAYVLLPIPDDAEWTKPDKRVKFDGKEYPVITQEGTQFALTIAIETRGDHGYALAPPSAGYKKIQGDLLYPPFIDAEQTDLLFALARSFNEYIEPKYQVSGPNVTTVTGKPGTAYNEGTEYLTVLQQDGWKVAGRRGSVLLLRRPGKDGRGISATANYGGRNRLHVFSTNAHPFEAERSYSPFAVYAFLRHDGNFQVAARELGVHGFGDPPMSILARENVETGIVHDLESDPETGEPLRTAAEIAAEQNEDYHIALLWAAEARHQWLFVEGAQWWEYAGHRWKYATEDFVHRHIQEFMVKLGKKVSPARVRNIMWTAKSMVGPVPMSDFNARQDWIPLANGVFDVGTGDLLPHDPMHRLTHCAPFEYDSQADCPLWIQCVNEWLIKEDGKPSEDWIGLVQEWFGYCMIPDNRAQSSMLWNGEGGNGKGVATRVLEGLVGRDNYVAISIDQLDKEYTRAALYGKLVGFVNEPDPKAMAKNGNWFKAIVGGDPIDARRPTERVFTFSPICRVIISTNELPSTRDTSTGYYRRLIMIDWRYNVPPERRDADLDDKLRLELPGIFNWAMEGLRRFQKRRKFSESEESKKLLEGYRNSQDNLRRFLDDNCVKGSLTRVYVASSDVYAAYKKWCETEGERIQSNVMLAKALVKWGAEKGSENEPKDPEDPGKGYRKVRSWRGVRFTSESGWDANNRRCSEP